MGFTDVTLDLQETHALLESQLDVRWDLEASRIALDTCMWVAKSSSSSVLSMGV